jgi:hypothetical protein
VQQRLVVVNHPTLSEAPTFLGAFFTVSIRGQTRTNAGWTSGKGYSMRNFVFTSLLLALIGGIGAANAQAFGRVTVPVSGLRNDDGVVRCGLYAAPEAFPKAGQESRGSSPKSRGDRRRAFSTA